MKDIIKKIVESAYQSKEGHIASSLSVLDILYVFYNNIILIIKKIDIGHSGESCGSKCGTGIVFLNL